MSHRWAVVAYTLLDDGRAAEIAAMDLDERLDRATEIIGQREAGQILGGPATIDGPLCTLCRVHWSDVHATTPPWPCPGKRPDDLGGPLRQSPRMSRRDLKEIERAKERQKDPKRTARAIEAALRASESPRPSPGDPESVQLDLSVPPCKPMRARYSDLVAPTPPRANRAQRRVRVRISQ